MPHFTHYIAQITTLMNAAFRTGFSFPDAISPIIPIVCEHLKDKINKEYLILHALLKGCDLCNVVYKWGMKSTDHQQKEEVF